MDTELGKAYYTPIFELTAEEVEMVKNTLEGLKALSIAIREAYNIGMNKNSNHEDIDFIADNLLNRIKQWQDERNSE